MKTIEKIIAAKRNKWLESLDIEEINYIKSQTDCIGEIEAREGKEAKELEEKQKHDYEMELSKSIHKIVIAGAIFIGFIVWLANSCN